MSAPIRFGSVCSGIEAASVAWQSLGWRAAWLSEIEAFPSAVLAHLYPDVPNLGDMTALPERITSGEVEAPDIFCGGTPCQAFSVAGLRKSLDDARGNLSLTFCEIANAIDHVRAGRGDDECVVFWENVFGVLNTKDNAFGCFLAGLSGEDDPLVAPGGRWTSAGCVFGSQRTVAWRVLDAQYFGLAQRRRRVFVVASARKGFDPAQVLFEWDGVRRDTAPRREARETAPIIPARSTAGGDLGTDFDCDGGVITMAHSKGGAEIGFDRGPTLTCNHEAPIAAYSVRTANTSSNGWGIQEEVTHTLDCAQGQCIAFPANLSATQCASTEELAPSMGAKNPTAVAVQASQSGVRLNETVGTLDANYGSRRHNGVMQGMQVRRLTPTEAERLMGFPDGYTAIPWRKKPASECPDGPRYQALGNSWAVPNVAWIGRRIQAALRNS